MEETSSQVKELTVVPPGARRWWVLLFSLHAPGAGLLVIGRWRRALAWVGAVALVGTIFELVIVSSHSARAFWALAACALGFHALAAIDAWRAERPPRLPSVPAVLIATFLLGCVFGGLAFGLRMTLLESFQMPSGGMYPTLHVGDHFLVSKRARPFEHGDVVVFDYPLDPSTPYLKRVVGLPGDVVQLNGGVLSINGRAVERHRLNEPCEGAGDEACSLWEESFEGRSWRVSQTESRASRDFDPKTVPPARYFVLGDNRDNSSDSRVWGTVPERLMKAKALFIWWSREGDKVRWDRVNLPVR
jgi:signal peptidase I